MRNIFILLLLVVMTGGALQAQVYKRVGDSLVQVDTVKNPKAGYQKTPFKVEVKDIKYDVYEGNRGGLFIWRVSKKTGKEYKQYLKIE